MSLLDSACHIGHRKYLLNELINDYRIHTTEKKKNTLCTRDENIYILEERVRNALRDKSRVGDTRSLNTHTHTHTHKHILYILTTIVVYIC